MSEKKVRGRPFPKGKSGNPGGRRKVDPELLAVLEAGNMDQLKRLWKLSESKNERVALTAITVWLLKTLPNAEKLEVTGSGGGPVRIEAVRERLTERLAKLLEARRAAEAKALPPG